MIFPQWNDKNIKCSICYCSHVFVKNTSSTYVSATTILKSSFFAASSKHSSPCYFLQLQVDCSRILFCFTHFSTSWYDTSKQFSSSVSHFCIKNARYFPITLLYQFAIFSCPPLSFYSFIEIRWYFTWISLPKHIIVQYYLMLHMLAGDSWLFQSA